MCVAAKNREKFTQNPLCRLQGRSTSSMFVPPESSSAMLVIISSKSVSICNRSHERRANSGKITIFKEVPLIDALVRGESSHPIFSPIGTKICSQETRGSSLLYGENPESLSHLGLNRYRVVTDGQTDRQTDRRTTDRIRIANTR